MYSGAQHGVRVAHTFRVVLDIFMPSDAHMLKKANKIRLDLLNDANKPSEACLHTQNESASDHPVIFASFEGAYALFIKKL